jgi:hypothetical protein
MDAKDDDDSKGVPKQHIMSFQPYVVLKMESINHTKNATVAPPVASCSSTTTTTTSAASYSSSCSAIEHAREAQTHVCFDQSQHPRWNAGVFTLTVLDDRVDFLSITCMNARSSDMKTKPNSDHIIGSCYISVFALVEMAHTKVNDHKRWTEGWFPIFRQNPHAQMPPPLHHAPDNVGDIRLEYRFLPDDTQQQHPVLFEVPSKYINCRGSTGGTLYVTVVQAKHVAAWTAGTVHFDLA